MTANDKTGEPQSSPSWTAALQQSAISTAKLTETLALKAVAASLTEDSILEKQVKEAEARQKIAEAEKAAAIAKKEQIEAFIPNLASVEGSKLAVAGEGPAVMGNQLTFGALRRIGEKVVNLIPDGPNWRIYVTNEQDLAALSARYIEIKLGFKQLIEAANGLLKDTELGDIGLEPHPPLDVQPSDPEAEGTVRATLFARTSAAAVAGALATAVPQVISLLSTNTSVSTASVSVTDLAAAAAIAGAFPKDGSQQVFHDEFRLVRAGCMQALVTNLNSERQTLTTRKLEITRRKMDIDSRVSVAKSYLATLEAELKAAKTKPARERLATRIQEWRKHFAEAEARSAVLQSHVSAVDALSTTIDTFDAVIRNAPEGATRSPLIGAMLFEQIDEGQQGKEGGITHLLLVKSQGGQTTQIVRDRPLVLSDKLATIAEISVSFVLIGAKDSNIVRSGTVTGVVQAFGEFGKGINFKWSILEAEESGTS